MLNPVYQSPFIKMISIQYIPCIRHIYTTLQSRETIHTLDTFLSDFYAAYKLTHCYWINGPWITLDLSSAPFNKHKILKMRTNKGIWIWLYLNDNYILITFIICSICHWVFFHFVLRRYRSFNIYPCYFIIFGVEWMSFICRLCNIYRNKHINNPFLYLYFTKINLINKYILKRLAVLDYGQSKKCQSAYHMPGLSTNMHISRTKYTFIYGLI